MTTRPTGDVVVVGGGVIGLSVAWEASRTGHRVTLVDPSPGRGASWAAAGMLAPVGEAHFGEESLIALNLEAARAWPGFAADLEEDSGRSVDYIREGCLLVAVDASDRAATDDVLAFQLDLGLSARRLSSRECREAEPLLTPGIRGGSDLGDDHQVDNRRVVEALLTACRRRGVTLVADEVTSVVSSAGRVSGVALGRGDRLSAGTVVLAAGARSGQVDGVPDTLRPPVRPVRGLTLRLGAPESAPRLRRTVRGLVHGRSCYLVPRRDGTVVVGATVEEKGFDASVPLGTMADLIVDARSLVPAIDDYVLVDTSTGLRPGSPDNAPVVGTGGLDGLVVATGHFRNGILLAPVTAHEVVRLLSGGSPGLSESDAPAGLFAPFGPERFASPPSPTPTPLSPSPTPSPTPSPSDGDRPGPGALEAGAR